MLTKWFICTNCTYRLRNRARITYVHFIHMRTNKCISKNPNYLQSKTILVSDWENFRRSFSCGILNEFLNDKEKKSRQTSGFFGGTNKVQIELKMNKKLLLKFY